MRMILVIVAMLVSAMPAFSQSVKDKQAGTVRVGVVDIAVLLNRYGDSAFQQELEDTLDPLWRHTKAIEIFKDEISGWQRMLNVGIATKEQEAQYKAAIKNSQRELDEFEVKVKAARKKWQEDNLVRLWQEIQSAARAYAVAHEVDVVLAHGDSTNMKRTMQILDSGGLLPLFVSPRTDITDDIIQILHRQQLSAETAQDLLRWVPPKLVNRPPRTIY